jgi:hypothetical protein
MSSDRNKDEMVKKMLEKEPEGLDLWNRLTVKKKNLLRKKYGKKIKKL